jgi:DNA-binding NtrC family response regulator
VDNLTLFAILLSEFNVDTALGAEEALAKLEQGPYAIVLSDQRMPGMTGNELMAIVRQRWPDMVRVIISAYSDHELIEQARGEQLAHAYFVKPYDANKLLTVIRSAVRRAA